LESQKRLLVWYDIQDQTKIQLSAFNTQKVLKIMDKGVLGNDIIQMDKNYQPDLVLDNGWSNGSKYGISFASGGYMHLLFPKEKKVAEITSFVVCKNEVGGSKLLYDLGKNGGEGIASCYSGSDKIESRVPNSLYGFVPDFSNNPNKYLVICTRGSKGNLDLYVNGKYFSGIGTRFFEGNTFNQIRLSTKEDVAPSNGILYELIIFDERLSDEEFVKVKDYLSNKYIFDDSQNSIDKTNNSVPSSENLKSISSDIAVNKIGSVVSKYDEIQSIASSNANVRWVRYNNKFGFINSKSILVIPIKYEKIGDAAWSLGFNAHGLCNVMINNKWGLVDLNGVEVVAPRYNSPLSFSEGLALAIDEGKGFFVIDVKGNILINFSEPKYREISQWAPLFKDGKLEVKYKGAWTFIDRNGVLMPNKFSNSALKSLTVGDELVSDKIYNRFLKIFNDAASKVIYYSALNKKYNNYSSDIAAATANLKKEVEGWISGNMSENQEIEFIGLKVMAEKEVERNLAATSKMLRDNPGFAKGSVYGNSSRPSQNSPSASPKSTCSKCSKGFEIRDYDEYAKSYSNFRRETKYGFIPCSKCQGTKKMSVTAGSSYIGKGCNSCSNTGWQKCNMAVH
jgi:hypothetical protein